MARLEAPDLRRGVDSGHRWIFRHDGNPVSDILDALRDSPVGFGGNRIGADNASFTGGD